MNERTSRVAKGSHGPLGSGTPSGLPQVDQLLVQQTERFSALIDIGTQISTARDVDQLLQTVMSRLTTLLSAEAATLFVHDPHRDELWSRVLKGATLREIRIPASSGLAGAAFSTGKTVHLGDAYSDPRFTADIDRKSGFRTRSLIAAPLRHLTGRLLGVIEVLDRRSDFFTSDDRALVEGVAGQVAAVLDTLLVLEELKASNTTLKGITEQLAQRVHDLDALYSVERAISSSEAQAELIDRILRSATEVVGASAGSILLAEESRSRLHFRSVRGERSEALQSLAVKSGQGIVGHVAATGTIVRVMEATSSELYDPSVAKRLGVSVGAVLCVPIRGESKVLGALELLNKRGGFSQADERLAVLLAGQLARALSVQQSREEVDRRSRLATIGQMLAGVLHDLRTPMTVISGYAELMVREAEETTRRDMAKTILSQLDHVAAMQKETLAFARGEKSLLVRRVYLHAFMAELEQLLAKEFEGSPVQLSVDTAYAGAARFDETKLKRAIFNLSRNALDAMPGGGRFVLRVDREGADLVFRAQDNGPGIPDEIADHLFESFVTSGKKSGTGLGLAVVRRIAQEHGGSVSFTSKAGKGTTFELRLPAGVPED